MGSRLIGSFGYWDHIGPDLQVTNYSFIPNACSFVIVIICLKEFGLNQSDPIKRHLLYFKQLCTPR